MTLRTLGPRVLYAKQGTALRRLAASFDRYIKPTGSDAADGSSTAAAWATLAKGQTSGGGLALALAAAAVFREQYTAPTSGTQVAPARLGPFGTGATPIVRGSDVVTGTWAAYAAQAGGGELLTNGGFETWTNTTTATGWTATGATQDATSPHSGTYAARLDVPANNSNVFISQTVTYTAGQVLTASYWHKRGATTGTMGQQLRIMSGTYNGYMLQADGSWSLVDPGLAPFTPGTSYAQFTRTFTMPDAGGTVRLLIGRSAAASAALYIDEASFAGAAIAAPDNVYRIARAADPKVLSRLVAGALQRVPYVATIAGLVENSWTWDSAFLYFRSATVTPATQTFEAGSRDRGVVLNATTDQWISGLQIDGTRQEAIFFVNGANRGRVTDCTIERSVGPGRNGGISASNSDDIIYRRNTVRDVSSDGLYALNSRRILVEDNHVDTVYGEFSDNLQLDYVDPAARAAANWIVRRNTFNQQGSDTTKGNAVLFGDGGTLEDNDCRYGNFGISLPGNNVVSRRNTFRHHGALGSMRIADDTPTVYDNHLYDHCSVAGSVYGVLIQSTGGSARTNLIYQNVTIADCTVSAFRSEVSLSGQIVDSILWAPNRTQALLVVPSTTGSGFTISNTTLGPEVPGVPLIIWNGTTYNTLAAWQAATGNGVGCTVADPLFVNPAGDDYSLQAGTPVPTRGAQPRA